MGRVDNSTYVSGACVRCTTIVSNQWLLHCSLQYSLGLRNPATHSRSGQVEPLSID